MDKDIKLKPSIGILLISTWKYNKFIDDTIAGIRKYFFPNSTVKIFLHTDSILSHDVNKTIPIIHQPWPLMTLFRYDLFNKNIDQYDTDYLFYLDIDTDIIDLINEDILSDLVVVKHGCFRNTKGTPETNMQSLAYISPEENLIYVCGGFVGGEYNYFKRLCTQLSQYIQKDYQNNIIAIWHDESHLNRYIQSNKNFLNINFLDSSYMKHMLCDEPNNIKMIAYSDFAKGFNKKENPHAQQ